MAELVQNAGRSLPFILLLLALLGLRMRVTPRASVFINAPPQDVYRVIDL